MSKVKVMTRPNMGLKAELNASTARRRILSSVGSFLCFAKCSIRTNDNYP